MPRRSQWKCDIQSSIRYTPFLKLVLGDHLVSVVLPLRVEVAHGTRLRRGRHERERNVNVGWVRHGASRTSSNEAPMAEREATPRTFT